MIRSMDLALNDGLMERLMRDITNKAKNMAKESSCGVINPLLLENSTTTISMGLEFTNGTTAEFTQATGKIIKWTVMVRLLGLMGDVT